MGDDVAEALALLGVRPVWQTESGRVTGVEVIPLAELGRPRIDVTLRISGFFRDAFPGLVALLDDAVNLVAGAATKPRPTTSCGPTASTTLGSSARSPARYGSGILAVIESRDWRDRRRPRRRVPGLGRVVVPSRRVRRRRPATPWRGASPPSTWR